jgi:hypothetical protein
MISYCELKKNKIYEEMYDELLDEELSMNNPEHNDKIKNYLNKKINSSNFVSLSNDFSNTEELMEDLILKITSVANNTNLQGNTLMMYANDDEMYELFHMEDLTQTIRSSGIELNEYGSLTNIFLQPVCWTCGIFKSTYKTGKIQMDRITKSDVSKLFISNYYHKGVMVNPDKTMIEIEFTGEEPFRMIGNNYTQSTTIDLFGFSIVSWIEKINNTNLTTDSNQFNEIASKILGSETYGRVFFSLVCPNTNKKFWDITIKTIENISKVIGNKEIENQIQKEVEMAEININPFYIIKKHLLQK